MHPIHKLSCRIFQTAFHLTLPLLPYREPTTLRCVDELPSVLKKEGKRHVLLVTGSTMCKSEYFLACTALLDQSGISYTLYNKTQANPTTANVRDAKELYLKSGCDCILAFGGGSPMDCAKACGALLAYPNKSMQQLKGVLKVKRPIPLLIAIPTTAGSGSETTLTAVITDEHTHHKYTVNSFPLIPRYAVLDPKVTFSLPKHLTATTGMDALTHAIEVYVGRSTTKQTKAQSLEAIRLIFDHLPTAYRDPQNEAARAAMLRASYLAGCAFSKSYVGYVHAVAHTLGGAYDLPHGLANAVLLSIILREYGPAVHQKLYELAIAVGIASEGEPIKAAAEKLIAAIEEMNAQMNIPTGFAEIRQEEIPALAALADKEANPLYPVPVLWDQAELCTIYEKARL